MILKVYAIYDLKVTHYMQPFYQQTHGAALRAFTDAVNDPGSPLNKHPEDYQLHHLADYEDQDGTFVNRTKPELIQTGTEALIKPRDVQQLDITEAITRKLKGA